MEKENNIKLVQSQFKQVLIHNRKKVFKNDEILLKKLKQIPVQQKEATIKKAKVGPKLAQTRGWKLAELGRLQVHKQEQKGTTKKTELNAHQKIAKKQVLKAVDLNSQVAKERGLKLKLKIPKQTQKYDADRVKEMIDTIDDVLALIFVYANPQKIINELRKLGEQT